MGRGWLVSTIFFTYIFTSTGFCESTEVAAVTATISPSPSIATRTEPSSPVETKKRQTVDLSYLFPQSEAPAQEGSTCHVYSAAALIEASCRRELGRPVSVSRAFLVAHHLSRAMAEQEMDLGHSEFGVLMGDYSPFDRGYAVDSLKFVRAKRRLVTDEELPMSTPKLDFWRGSLGREIKHLSNAELSIQTEINRLRESLGETFPLIQMLKLRVSQRGIEEKHEQAYLEKLRAGLAAFDEIPETQDRDLKDCLALFDDSQGKSLKPTSYYYTPTTARALLDAEMPFACGGPMDGKYFYWDGWMNHSAVFVGYRDNDDFTDWTEYLVRDHNGKPASWGWGVEECGLTTLEMR